MEWKGGLFKPPLSSFIDQMVVKYVQDPSGDVGNKKRREGGERKKREKWEGALLLGACRGETLKNTKDSTLFQGDFLRFLSIKPYIYVLGCQICCFPNLFYENGWSFCSLKIVVHLGFEDSFHTRTMFDDFGSF